MLLDVVRMLAASIGFCISSSRELEAFVLSKDYVSAQLANGPIDRHWHGLHHWSTEKHFGYGTYDSISNLGSGGDPDKKEARLEGFLDEYLKLRAGTVKTVSMLRD
ncbi:unnamed protein product [Symbiodinium natans]|uniref:Uncharacterized protein n=1 Tax=Symbiodinium natans TaxID=878477 RepID=A0A812IX04_9DINO|nr:unnamed protein product [Symbiodinium natans]